MEREMRKPAEVSLEYSAEHWLVPAYEEINLQPGKKLFEIIGRNSARCSHGLEIVPIHNSQIPKPNSRGIGCNG